jgi:hypothetical protein
MPIPHPQAEHPQAEHPQADIVEYLASVQKAEHALLAHPACLSVLAHARAFEPTSLSSRAFTTLNLWRTRASDTLRRDDPAERVAWDNANARLAELLSEGQPLAFSFAAKLHHALGFSDSLPRTIRMYAADEEYLKPEYVREELEKMDCVLLSEAHPLTRAFVALVSMVTIHPFCNGNGRAARLLADAVLISEGFLPLSFASSIMSHVGRATRGVPRTVDDAIETFLGGLENSYDVVAGID